MYRPFVPFIRETDAAHSDESKVLDWKVPREIRFHPIKYATPS